MSRIPGPLGEGDIRRQLARLAPAIVDDRICAWATVELDRAESAIRGDAPGHARISAQAVADDDILGARCRLVHRERGAPLLLLEPATEGRLAASLARLGEGPVALYATLPAGGVEVLRAAGVQLSAEAGGPLGRQRLVVGGPRWGPHLIVIEEASVPNPAQSLSRLHRVPSPS